MHEEQEEGGCRHTPCSSARGLHVDAANAATVSGAAELDKQRFHVLFHCNHLLVLCNAGASPLDFSGSFHILGAGPGKQRSHVRLRSILSFILYQTIRQKTMAKSTVLTCTFVQVTLSKRKGPLNSESPNRGTRLPLTLSPTPSSWHKALPLCERKHPTWRECC